MKSDLVEYILALSEGQEELLMEILVNKYNKFRSFFELVRDYGDDIVKLKYNETEDEDSFDVTITMRTNVKKDVKKELREEFESLGYIITTNISKRKLNVVLTYKEAKRKK